jgi:hypothetical protein
VTTVATIRTTFLNKYLGIGSSNDADVVPWTSQERDEFIVGALYQTWPDIGLRATGSVATSQASDLVTIPGSIQKISRIELRQTAGGVSTKIDRIVDWSLVSDTQVRINPLLPTNAQLALHFYGWKPFAVDAVDLLPRLERVVAFRAASLAFSALSGQLGNLARQQGLDNARVVDYPTAVGLAALWERRYFEAVDKEPSRISVAPRGARR